MMVSDSGAAGRRSHQSARRLTRRNASPAFRASLIGCGAAALVTLTHLPSAAADRDLRATYEVTFAGLTFAHAEMIAAIRGNTYTVRINYRTSGAARLMSSAAGEVVSSGAYRGGRLIPATFDLDHQGRGRVQRIALAMSGGVVNRMTVDPPVTAGTRGGPVGSEHLKNIIDPLSALLVSAVKADGKNEIGACDRTVPVFDGVRRFDVALKSKETRIANQGPFTGPLTACELRVTLIAGEMRGEDGSRAATPRRPLGESEMTFGLVDALKIYLPVSLSAKIGYTTLEVRLTKFSNTDARIQIAR